MMATIGLIIDVLIVASIVIFGIIGFRKGFLKSFISLFSWVVCIVIAIFTAKYVAGWINGIYDFSSLIGDKITSGLNSTNEFFSQGRMAIFALCESTKGVASEARYPMNWILHNAIRDC